MYNAPYGDTQQLNLDWFIKRWKEFYAEWEAAEAGIDGALDAEIEKVENAMQDLYAARDAAAASASAAAQSANGASNSATTAGNAASAAAASATLANNKATAAGLSEAAAANSANSASNSAGAAATSASQANASAASATASAQSATASAAAAAASETNAAASETAAAASAEDAEESAQRAEDAAASASAGGIVKSLENVPIASVEDALNENVVELIVAIDPVQAGTGDPAPDNVRPITGWTGANIYRSGADTSDPTTYPITFPVEAGTVYGAKLINEGTETWKLRVEKAYALLNDPDKWETRQSGTVAYRYNYDFRRKLYSDSYTGLICSIVVTSIYSRFTARWQGATAGYFGIVDDNGVTSISAIKAMAANNEIEICYDIDPIEYTITGEVVEMLLGINNIWADTGNVDLLRYYADSKGYIDAQDALVKALIAKELDDMIADTALTANDFRIVNNTLYRITAPIASGATLTPNTNCTATTVSEILKTLLT